MFRAFLGSLFWNTEHGGLRYVAAFRCIAASFGLLRHLARLLLRRNLKFFHCAEVWLRGLAPRNERPEIPGNRPCLFEVNGTTEGWHHGAAAFNDDSRDLV